MLIAIAGTHRSGKTTLVEAFGIVHPEFRVEPEPYEQLQEVLGEEPPDDLSPESFERQLQYMCGRVSAAGPSQSVIFDRSPLDFLAHLRAIDELRLGTSDWVLDPGVLESARTALRRLHILALVRPASTSGRAGPRRGLRGLVDDYLSDLILRDTLGLLGDSGPEVTELAGSTSERLRQLNQVVARNAIPRPKRAGR